MMEKRLFFIFLLSFTCGELRSQTLTFEYEGGGNQVIRQYCAACPRSQKTSPQDQKTSTQEFLPRIDQIKIYPNPTKDKANLAWSPELEDMIQKIEYVAYNFTQYREILFNKKENKALLDLSDQPIGMYIVIFHLNTGEN